MKITGNYRLVQEINSITGKPYFFFEKKYLGLWWEIERYFDSKQEAEEYLNSVLTVPCRKVVGEY